MAATGLARPCRRRSSCPSPQSLTSVGVFPRLSWTGGLADVFGGVDVVDDDRDGQAAGARVLADGGDLLPVAVDEEDPLVQVQGVAPVGLVERPADHGGDVVGDRRGDPRVARGGSGAFSAAGGWGGDVLGLADGGSEGRDGDDLGHLLDPGMGGVAPGGGAVLGAQRDALAVGLRHQHVAGGEVARGGGTQVVEVADPAGQVVGELGELGAPDGDPGPRGDDLLGLPVAAGPEVEGRQGADPQRVGVVGERPAGVGRVEVRLAPVAVGEPGRPDRAEDADHAPVVALLDAAVADPGRGHQVADALFAGGVEGERGLQQRAQQFAAVRLERLLPVAVIQGGGAVDRPADQRGAPLDRTREQSGGLGVQRDPAAVLTDALHRHRNRHRRASVTCLGQGHQRRP
ncbi:hypothetical protein ThrDRAFT_02669 [Frankia casuarinae]|nr:hypothetical protein CcI6DRAFT_04884 [Frankia sp. CcI6]EYT91664.1 hypothetical protein ThrDRAFT_02669 [Frankia casuarinae]KEZ38281.1 hypothetical protein CEDDRAFT_00017 [Frankia sp. CeD]KFB05527.1 hypothetical protein ALLO2DRAFT_01767 [Frankia sp. Allo2]